MGSQLTFLCAFVPAALYVCLICLKHMSYQTIHHQFERLKHVKIGERIVERLLRENNFFRTVKDSKLRFV